MTDSPSTTPLPSLFTLHPRMVEVVVALELAQQDMLNVLDAIPVSQRDAMPARGGWTITAIVEHLAIIEDGAGRLLSNLIKQVKDTPETETDAIEPTLEHFQLWNPTRRIEAPDFVRPKGELSFDDALARQSLARARMIGALSQASGCALGTVTYPHPVLGPLTGYQWALVTAQHQRRHLLQIAAVSSSLSS